MADKQLLDLLEQGVDDWNSWRENTHVSYPNLFGADLRKANLRKVNFSGADLCRAILFGVDLSESDLFDTDLSESDLRGATLCRAYLSRALLPKTYLSGANLIGADLHRAFLRDADLSESDLIGSDLCDADLCGANLHGADLFNADLRGATLFGANLSDACLFKANLSGANLSEADLSRAGLRRAILFGANLRQATLVQTNFSGANLDGCLIYGVSAWGIKLEGALQSNLVITLPNEPNITVNHLEVAQFVYLLLNNDKIRDVINTITSKIVLILGRFTPDRKAVLDAIREELRKRNLLPILFDFGKPSTRNLTETVSTLAHMARFVIADITDAKSIPQELQRIVPELPSLPVQPLILSSHDEYGMFNDFKDYPWVLPTYRYASLEGLLDVLEEKVIVPVVDKAAEEIEKRRKISGQWGIEH